MSATTTLNLPTQKRGDTWDGGVITLTDADDEPISLAGATLLMQVRQAANRESLLLLSLSSTDGEIVIAGDGESATIQPVVVDILPGTRHYEIQIIFADGSKRTPFEGTWPIVDDVAHLDDE